jgi:hypothetical protein
VNASVPKIQKGHEPEAVPPLLLEAIVEGEEMKMRVLCLDWWEMGPNELDGLVKGCTGLAKLRVGITFPIVKLVSPVLIPQTVSLDLSYPLLYPPRHPAITIAQRKRATGRGHR